MSGGTSKEPRTTEVVDRMTDAFFALDDDWRLTYLNDGARRVLTDLLGGAADPTDLQGERVLHHLPEDGRERFIEQYERAMRDQEPVTFEEYYPPAEAWFEVRAYPSETGLSVYFRDVTERKRRAKQQERDQAALATLYRVASASDATFEEKLDRVLDLGRDYFGLSYGFLTEIEEGEDGVQRIVASQSSHELLQPGASCPLEEAYCRKTIETDGMLAVVDAVEDGWEGDPAYETFGLGSYIGAKVLVDGDLYGTLCFADSDPRDEPFRPTQGSLVELLGQWVGYELERKEAREELLDTNQRLERVTSVISHDLRNPLHVAKARLDMAREECDSEHLETVAASHDRMETLVSDLLTLARQGRTVDERSRVGLEPLVESAWETADTDEADLEVVDDSTFRADAERLQQALENLFANAAEHGSASSRPEADDAATHGAPEDETVTVEVGATDEGFYVADDGVGIPQSEREDVFASGYTTAEDGTGLGLPTVRRIVEAHGWSIDVAESEAGGARFEVTGVAFR